jgi:hypothetical protein
MKAALFLATLLLPLSALAGSGIATVPDRFIGQWAGSPDSCGSDSDDMILRIGPDHIGYWESEGTIKAVVVRGDNEIALISEMSGEGETWLSTAKFTLSQDGRQLIDNTSVPGREFMRYKCSGAVGTRSNNSFKPNPHRGTAWVLIRYASTQSPPRCGSA